MTDVVERLESQLFYDTAGTGCWLWVGLVGRTGYGRMRSDGRKWMVHRLSWTLFVGDIPDGLVVDHLCRTRNCVNPAHLRVCTQMANVHAPGSTAIAKAESERTHCPRDHILVAPNLVPSKLRLGFRECLACSRARNRVRYARIQGIQLDLQVEADLRYAALKVAS